MMLERVDVGDAEQVTHERTGGRASTRTDEDALAFCPVHEVLHDQEVAGEAGLFHDAKFVLHSFLYLCRRLRPVACVPSFFHESAKAGVRSFAVRKGKGRQDELPEFQLGATALRDPQGIFERPRDVPKRFRKMLRRLEAEIFSQHGQSVLIRHAGSRLHAEQNILGLGILRPNVMRVSRGDESDPMLSRERLEHVVHFSLLGKRGVMLNLEEESLPAENIQMPANETSGLGLVAAHDSLREVAVNASGKNNEPVGMCPQRRVVNARLPVKAVQVGVGDQFQEVPVAIHVLRENGKVPNDFLVRRALLGLLPVRDQVGFYPEDGTEFALPRFFPKLHESVENAMVREGDGVHAEFLNAVQNVRNLSESVEETVMTVYVKMCKLRHMLLTRVDACPAKSRETKRGAGGRSRTYGHCTSGGDRHTESSWYRYRMRRRLRKQLAVIAVLAAVFGGLGTLIAVIVIEPPPPPPPSPPSYEALAVRTAGLLRHSSGDRADLYAVVRNPNANAGVRTVDFTFEVRAGERVLTRVPGRTYFMPGQEKPIVALNETIPSGETQVRLTFGTPDWVAVERNFRPPSFVPVSRTATVRGEQSPFYEVKAVLANESQLDYLTVEVTALGLDERGGIIGAGRTFVGSLRSGERREFTVSWPLLPGNVVAEVRIVPEVNVFSSAAVQPRSGVPGLEPRPIGTPRQ